LRAEEVQSYLEEHIPLSRGMGIDVVEAGPHAVSIEVPLALNVNHRSTAFGGSVAALAILAGWTLVHLRLRDEGFVTHTVIQSSSVRFDAPIHGPFRAVCKPIEESAWNRFTRALARRGKGRVYVAVDVLADGIAAATFEGAYVAIDGRKSAGD
jgi:thioesterase domain-containing protein